MSNIVEITFALKEKGGKELNAVLSRDCNARSETVKYIGEFDNHHIYVMDSNGYPFDVGIFVCDNGGIFEINYLDGEGPYTEDEHGEAEKPLVDILNLPEEVVKRLEYSN